MSQDLLAAFGDFPSQPAKPGSSANTAPSFSFFDNFNNSNSNSNNVSNNPGIPTKAASNNIPHNFSQPGLPRPSGFRDDVAASQENDDDWGDFEGSTEVTSSQHPAAPTAPPVPVATQFSRWLDEEDDGFPDYTQKKAAPRPAGWDFTKPDAPVSIPQRQPQVRDPNVLFDAEDEPPPDDDDDDEDDDDFGDFEGADQCVDKPSSSGVDDLLGMGALAAPPPSSLPQNSTASTTKPSTSSSLLDLGELTLENESTNAWRTEDPKPPIHGFGTLGALSKPKSPTKPSAISLRKDVSKALGPKPSQQPSTAKPRNVLRKAPPPQPVATEDDEQWDDFEAWEHEGPTQAATTLQTSTPLTQRVTPTIPRALASSSAESTLASPPTNIPPPALVLSLFPPLFASAESSFFRPLRQEPTEVQHAVYSAAAVTTYLKGLLALATVCGRVIAGRKHRWKRDTILAQSMRIGPSAAGGVSGLKLTSIDKAEVAKEDREAADALKAWQSQVGKLKSAVAEVKRINGVDVGKIPELKDTLPAKVAKEIEGGLKGNRPCALCGLKREERVLRVDFNVEDSFGEWWVENVSMHRDCTNFWEQHRDTLRSR